MKILLIAGGWSSEREISLIGARGMQTALEARGHSVTFFDLLSGFDHLLENAQAHDFALINLHGAPGDWALLPQRPAPDWEPPFGWPVFAKSNTGGSSLHLGRAASREELAPILDEIFNAGECAIIEPQLTGREVTCGVLGEEALAPILIEPVAGEFFDFTSKYAKGGAREICPAPLSEDVTAEVRRIALAAHKALGLAGYSRADFILGADDSLHLLEVNTLPGMTPTSLVPQEAAVAGLDFGQLLERLIELGLERHAATARVR